MKVFHTPKFSNPYQTLLVSELQNIEVEASVGGLPNYFVFNSEIMSQDVIHLHWLHPFFVRRSRFRTFKASVRFVCQLLFMRVVGTRLVWTCHNLVNHEKKFPRIDYFCARAVSILAHSVIVHGYLAKEEVNKYLSVPLEKISVIEHGNYLGCYPGSIRLSDVGARRFFPDKSDEIVFLIFGNVRSYKGIELVLKALANFPSKDYKVVIAGKPGDPDIDAWVMAYAESNINVVYLNSRVNDSEVGPLYECADIVVLPSSDILTSGSMILAMSMGRACLAPNYSYIQGVLSSQGAFIYEPGSDTSIREELSKIFSSKNLLSAMGKRNLDVVSERGWAEIAERTKALYL